MNVNRPLLRLFVGFLVLSAASCTGQPEESGHDSNAAAPEIVEPSPVVDVSAGESPLVAAVRAVSLTDEVLAAGFISRRSLIESFSTDEFGGVLADVTSEQITNLLFELGERDADPTELKSIEQPITAQLVSESPTRAVVEVWSVMVVAAPDVGPGRQVWRTVTIDLELADGHWLVDGWHSVLGPTPSLAAESTISSGQQLVDVLVWSPAVAFETPGGA